MYRKIISSILIVVLFATLFVATAPVGSIEANAEEFRGGYSLVPESQDASGVTPDSRYTFKSQGPVTLAQLQQNLSIDGEPAPAIQPDEHNRFIIAPSRAFERNRLYTFRLKQEGVQDITWTFQTNALFRILGSLPGNRSNNVPVNTGIEIYFTHTDYEDLNAYFEIIPKVSGSFERHKRAVVFVPSKPLAEGTLYTVTVKKGLKLKGTDQSLETDYTFRFETEKQQKPGEESLFRGYFSYNRLLTEYRPSEKPLIPISYGINQDVIKEDSVILESTIYGYSNVDTFLKALKAKDLPPQWAYFSYQSALASTSGLNRVLQFETRLPVRQEGTPMIQVPQTLPAGYYLVDSLWDKQHFQTFLQVTDIGMYVMKSETKSIIWLHDLSNGKPLEGASVSQVDGKGTWSTDRDGVAAFDSFLKATEEQADEKAYLKVSDQSGRNGVLLYYPWAYSYGSGSNLYWNYLYLDRNLYHPEDTVQLWGLVKNRYDDEKIGDLTLEISQGSYYYRRSGKSKVSGDRFYFPFGTGEALLRKTISTENGIFQGNVALPALEPGSYQLSIRKGDEVLISSYLTVEDYTKPTYKIDITRDREAVFLGQPVNFTLQAAFFEGTPLPGLQVAYNLSSGMGDSKAETTSVTDAQGRIRIPYTPSALQSNAQGENYAWLYCHSSLPEMGEMTGNSSVRVFINDIQASLTAKSSKGKGTLEAKVNHIVLDRLNNGQAKDLSDYLGDPASGKLLHATLIRTTWLKVEDGQYYDFINKKVQKRYRYEDRKETLATADITTSAAGLATWNFDAPELSDGYYTVVLTCQDSAGRSMKYEAYVGREYEALRYASGSYEDNRYYLDGGKESYALGEKVSLVYKKGQQSLPQGQYLFVHSQNGIRSWQSSSDADHTFALAEKDIPNIYVTGIYFNGNTCVESDPFSATYDSKEKGLVLKAETDKASYKPGDEVVIRLFATDKTGKPKKSVVNASIVDEALFSLQDQSVDTLQALYSPVSSGISYSYSSHRNDGGDRIQMFASRDQKADSVAAEAPQEAKMKNAYMDTYNGSAAPRQDFRDTALFKTVSLNEEGKGVIRFKLPDNVTSWRVTLSGMSSDLYAGSDKVTLTVSLPFFLNYTMNTTYLTGDMPVVGVTAYGSGLKAGDPVSFEVTDVQDPFKTIRVQGKALERVNLPLWKLPAGKLEVDIKAAAGGGLADAVRHKATVVDTYHQISKADYSVLKAGMPISGGISGNTTLIFTDGTRGQFLPQLANLLYTPGNRIDQKLSVRIAWSLLQQYFPGEYAVEPDDAFKAADYQGEDGGIALLPYGDSDLETSARTAPFLILNEGVDTARLSQYFYSTLYGDEPGLKANALYGLAALKQPVLLDLDRLAAVENAGVRDLLYTALGYCQVGETFKAQKLYNEKIKGFLQELKPYFRINTGADQDDILTCTSLAAILASQLDLPEKKGLYDYCLQNRTTDILITLEQLLCIRQEIEKYQQGTATVTYTYEGKKETLELKNGWSHTLTLPSRNLSHLKIGAVQGNVSLATVYSVPVTQAGVGKTDSNLSVSRKYYQAGDPNKAVHNFKENDIVKVVINWDIGAKALEGGYEITDFAPSGLKPIENATAMGISPDQQGWYKSVDGQKVTFHVYSGWTEKRPLWYYARVITPGTYRADGTFIQSIASRDSLNVGTEDVVGIE